MIQLNLLPDIKLEYLKTERTKRKIILISSACAGAALLLLLMLFVVVNVLQKQHLNSLNKDIKTYSAKLSGTTDLNKILTIQNQLESLPAMHDQKVVASRLFSYMSQLTPNQASIASLKVDFVGNTISFSGTADALETVNKFTDTLKFTTFKTADGSSEDKAFSNVVLTNFSRDDKITHYQIDAHFAPVIFDNAQEASLITPKIISTRSETEKPAALFQQEDKQ